MYLNNFKYILLESADLMDQLFLMSRHVSRKIIDNKLRNRVLVLIVILHLMSLISRLEMVNMRMLNILGSYELLMDPTVDSHH